MAAWLALLMCAGASSKHDCDLGHRLRALASSLLPVEQFYDSIGGVMGYQCRSLQLIVAGTAAVTASNVQQHHNQPQPSQPSQQQQQQEEAAEESVSYHVPKALDLAGEEGREVGMRVALAGLLALPQQAEIYPLGGAD
jgi:hypothetical protein